MEWRLPPPYVLSCLSSIWRLSYGAPSEGSYLIVNKNLIELFIMIFLSFTESGQFFGVDMLRKKKARINPEKQKIQENSDNDGRNSRRELIKALTGLPVLALFSGAFFKNLVENGTDAVSGATIKLIINKLTI